MEVPISERDQAEGLPPLRQSSVTEHAPSMEVPISERDQAKGLLPWVKV